MSGAPVNLPENVSIAKENETLLKTFENMVAADGKLTNESGGGKRRRSNEDTAKQPPAKRPVANDKPSRKKSLKKATLSTDVMAIHLRPTTNAAGSITFHDLVQMCGMCETALSREERKNLVVQLQKILRPEELAACTGNTKHRQIREICRTLMYCGAVNPDLARQDMLRRFERYGVYGVPVNLLTDKLMVRNIDLWMNYASNECCEWQTNGMSIDHVQWCEPGHNTRLIGRPCRSCAHAFVRVTRHGGALWTECKPAVARNTPAKDRRRSGAGDMPQLDDVVERSTRDAINTDWPSASTQSPMIPVASKNINRDSPYSPMSYDDEDEDGGSDYTSSDDDDKRHGVEYSKK